mgnify:CR=1 FL=1
MSNDASISKKSFLISSYKANVDGFYIPPRPKQCPEFCYTTPCKNKIIFHSFRQRKVGPKHNLAIFFCSDHKRYFTTYPPGWLPWKRQPLQKMNPEGYPIKGEDLFTAAEDIARGEKWPETGNTGKMVFHTQRRHIYLISKIFGFYSDIKLLHHLSLIFNLAEIDLRSSMEHARDGPLRVMGKEGVAILQKLKDQGEKISNKIYHAGYLIGLWGKPIFLSTNQ